MQEHHVRAELSSAFVIDHHVSGDVCVLSYGSVVSVWPLEPYMWHTLT